MILIQTQIGIVKGQENMDVHSLLIIIIKVSLETLLVFFYLNNSTLKYGTAITAMGYFGYWLLNISIKYSNSPVWIVALFEYVVIVILAGWLYRDISTKSAIKLTGMFWVTIYIAELIVTPLHMLITGTYDIKVFFIGMLHPANLVTFFWARVVAVALLLWIAKLERKYRYDQLRRNDYFIIYGLLGAAWLAVILTRAFFFYNSSLAADRNASVLLLIIVLLLVLYAVACLNFIDNYLMLGRKSKENQILQQRLEIQASYHRQMAEDLENLKLLRHDLKNHLLLVGQETSYGCKLMEKIEVSDKYIESGNELFNMLVYEKIAAAQQLGIDVKIFLSAGDINFLDDLDICSIFGNILDNALEACEQFSDRSGKNIELEVTTIQDFLMIVLVNDCPKTVSTSCGSQALKSTKKQTGFHGIGLVSLKKSVEKYGGNCSYKQTDGRFETKIIIPVPAEAD